MRRLLTAVAASSLIAALVPAMTLAAPPLRESETNVSMSCDGVSGDAGSVSIFAISGDFVGSYGGLALWTTGDPASTGANVVSIGGSVDWDGLTMTATFELVEIVESTDPDDPFVFPAGTAGFEATLAPSGSPQILWSFQDRSGSNRISRGEEAFQLRSVEGTLEVDLLTGPVAEYDMSVCFASSTTLSFSVTNPTASVLAASHVLVTCRWDTPDGHVHFAVLGAETGAVEVFEGESDFSGIWELSLTSSGFEAEIPLHDGDTGEAVGTATASGTLARAEPLKTRDRSRNLKVTTTGWLLSVDGTLNVTTPNGTNAYVIDDSSCYAEDVLVKTIESYPNGPKLKNDDPSRAQPIELGQTVSVWTGVSAFEPEAPCVGGGLFSTAISHTGWWTFVGTGGEVTIDTAGSDFDTILGVYLPVSSGFEEIGCADDTFGPEPGEFSLQAALTLDTVAGTTYYLQVGGFWSSGQLVLRID